METQSAKTQFLRLDVLRQMLVEKGSVSIRGVGTLKLFRNAANLIPIEQRLLPPSYQIQLHEYEDSSYDEQRYIDLYYTNSKYNWEDFNEYVLSSLVNYGKCEIEGVGLLQRDLSGHISFLPNQNFLMRLNQGFPDIQLIPLKKILTPSNFEVGQVTPTPFSKEKKSFNYKWISGILLLIVLCFYVWRYLDYTYQLSIRENNEIMAEPETIPTTFDEVSMIDSGAKSGDGGKYIEESVVVDEVQNTINCIIIVGSFKSKKNVNRMLKKLSEMGYNTYYENFGIFTRVGVTFDCPRDKLVDSIVSIRSRIEPKSWFLSPELTVEPM